MATLCRLAAIAFLGLTITACSDSSDRPNNGPVTPPIDPPLEPTFSAEVRRTEYGIPHIKAENWGSLGYGYAYAQDNFCVTMREVALTSGRWPEFTGQNIDRDFLWRYINGTREEFTANFFDKLPTRDQELITGRYFTNSPPTAKASSVR